MPPNSQPNQPPAQPSPSVGPSVQAIAPVSAGSGFVGMAPEPKPERLGIWLYLLVAAVVVNALLFAIKIFTDIQSLTALKYEAWPQHLKDQFQQLMYAQTGLRALVIVLTIVALLALFRRTRAAKPITLALLVLIILNTFIQPYIQAQMHSLLFPPNQFPNSQGSWTGSIPSLLPWIAVEVAFIIYIVLSPRVKTALNK